MIQLVSLVERWATNLLFSTNSLCSHYLKDSGGRRRGGWGGVHNNTVDQYGAGWLAGYKSEL